MAAHLLPALYFAIAALYSSAGFGGGSSYIAVAVLMGLPYGEVAAAALTCNLIVSAGGTWRFARAGYLRLERVAPFLISSIPMAYFGGRMRLPEEAAQVLLGLCLLAAAARLFLPERRMQCEPGTGAAWRVGIPSGAALGLLAGLVGIGGGIFLSPLLLLMRWASPKEAAAAAALFIFMNSLAGLAGRVLSGAPGCEASFLLPLALAACAGGQIGSSLGAGWLPKQRVQQATSLLVLFVAVQLIREGLL